MRIGFGLQALKYHGLRIAVVALRQLPCRLHAFAGVGAVEQNGGAHKLQFVLEVGFDLGGQCLFDQWQFGLVGRAEQRGDCGAAYLVVLGEELERRERNIEFAAHHVVVHNVLGRVGHRQCRASNRVDALAITNNDDLIAVNLDCVVRQRLNERRRSVVGVGQRLVQGLDPRVALTSGNGLCFRRSQRIGAAGNNNKNSQQK